MKKIVSAISLVLMLLAATACEDYLQKDPPSSPSQAIFWKSKADFCRTAFSYFVGAQIWR